jgi:hypothetical protein
MPDARPDLQPRPPKSQRAEGKDDTTPALGKRKSGDMDDLKLSNGNKRGKTDSSQNEQDKKQLEECEEEVPVAPTVLIGEEVEDGYKSNEEVFEDEDVL